MLVVAELAKEKLIRRIEGVFMDLSCTQDAHGVAQLIRNTDLTDCQQTEEILREAIVAMAEDGWLYFGEEGMSDAQEKCLAAYEYIKGIAPAKPQKAKSDE